jgi:endoglucanase
LKKYIIQLIVIVLISIQTSYGFFKTFGFDIVDSDGNPFILKGYGLGGWLVPEGYMLHDPGYGSPGSIRNQIIELIGEENTTEFFELYRKNYVSERDIELIAEWGFNSIRLPFHYQFFSPIDSPGVFIDDGFRIVDSLLVWCKRNNLYLILDMHCAPGGQNSGNISDSDGEAKLWTIASNQERTIEIWRHIAEYYADEDWIIGYDLLNEPVLPDGYTNTDLKNLYISIKNAVREVDPNHILFIEGNWYATDFTGLTPKFDSNMVYAFHKYWNATDLSSIQQYRNLRTQNITPLWLGESGENSNSWYFEVVKLMEAQSIGWNWWAPKKFDTITSPLSAQIPAGYQQIIDYWSGNASKPSVEFAKSALFEMANNLSVEKCIFHPDVIAALTDPEFGTVVKPYIEHTAPGTIMAVDYDLGTIGIAYFDNDYIRTDYTQNQPWNLGYAYRNDGVDIEQSSNSNDYNIGWLEDGEWVKYTIEVLWTGRYEISLKIATPNSGGKLRLLLDDQIIANDMPIPATGGWQNWDDINTEAIELPGGKHQLKLYFTKGGFNFQSINFIALGSSIVEKITPELLIGKSYPNPFNDQTTIPIMLAQAQKIQLSVYDLRGNLVKNLYSGAMPRGLNEIRWDGTNNFGLTVAAGTYYYQLFTNSTKVVTKAMLYLK